jgi:hypothetical protein
MASTQQPPRDTTVAGEPAAYRRCLDAVARPPVDLRLAARSLIVQRGSALPMSPQRHRAGRSARRFPAAIGRRCEKRSYALRRRARETRRAMAGSPLCRWRRELSRDVGEVHVYALADEFVALELVQAGHAGVEGSPGGVDSGKLLRPGSGRCDFHEDVIVPCSGGPGSMWNARSTAIHIWRTASASGGCAASPIAGMSYAAFSGENVATASAHGGSPRRCARLRGG